MKEININAPVKCNKSIYINAIPQKVWSVLTNIDDWARWQTDIHNPKLNGELRINTTFDWKTGGAKIKSTLHTVEPFEKFGWTGKSFGLYAIHNWKITAVDRKTEVLVEERMEGLLAVYSKNHLIKTWKKVGRNGFN